MSALGRAEGQAVILAAKLPVEIEDRAAEAATRIDDARRLHRPALSKVEGTDHRQNPLVNHIGAGNRGIARLQQPVNGERLISATLPDPAGDTLEPGEPVVVARYHSRQCVIPYIT